MWYLLNNTKGWSIQRDNNILDQFYSTVLVLPVQLLLSYYNSYIWVSQTTVYRDR